jgi:hypothetical protein
VGLDPALGAPADKTGSELHETDLLSQAG